MMQLLLLQHIPRHKLDIPFLVTFIPELKLSSVRVAPLTPSQIIIPPKMAERERLVPAMPKRGILRDLDYREHANSPLATQIKRYVKDALYFNYVERHNEEMARVSTLDENSPFIRPKPRPTRQTVDKEDFGTEVKRFYKNLPAIQLELRHQQKTAVSMMSLLMNGFVNLLMLNGVCRSLFLRMNLIAEPQNTNPAALTTPFRLTPLPDVI